MKPIRFVTRLFVSVGLWPNEEFPLPHLFFTVERRDEARDRRIIMKCVGVTRKTNHEDLTKSTERKSFLAFFNFVIVTLEAREPNGETILWLWKYFLRDTFVYFAIFINNTYSYIYAHCDKISKVIKIKTKSNYAHG